MTMTGVAVWAVARRGERSRRLRMRFIARDKSIGAKVPAENKAKSSPAV
jgi:hypothetical protein